MTATNATTASRGPFFDFWGPIWRLLTSVRFAVFYDAGFVNKGAYDFSPANFTDNFGFGIRLFVAGSPLSLDFGIPLTADKQSKKGNQFNFSFGTRY